MAALLSGTPINDWWAKRGDRSAMSTKQIYAFNRRASGAPHGSASDPVSSGVVQAGMGEEDDLWRVGKMDLAMAVEQWEAMEDELNLV
jgi:hypothetical protein